MNALSVKRAAYQQGFQMRLNQLMLKAAHDDSMSKESMNLVRGLGRMAGGARRIIPRMAAGAGRAVSKVKNLGTEVGAEFNQAAGRGLSASQARLLASKRLKSINAGGGSKPPVTSPTPTAAATGPTLTPIAKQAPAAPAAAAPVAPGMGGKLQNVLGWMGTNIDRRIPVGARSWMRQNPGLTAAGGAVAGGGAVAAGDQYADARRRSKIRDLGAMQRLMLAGQMVFSPEGAIQSMRL